MDRIISHHARELTVNIHPQIGLSSILEGVSHFNFHLYRCNTANPLQDQVKVVLRRLKRTNIYNNPDDRNDAMYEPDGEYDLPLSPWPVPDNTIFVDTVTQSTDRVFYGLSVENYSDFKLFPYFFFFDPSDYSIQSWYHPPSTSMRAPLASVCVDGKPSIHPVGYGNSGSDAIEFALAPRVMSDAGFLKLIVSTTNIDLSDMNQLSPFTDIRVDRLMGRAQLPEVVELNIWDSFMYVLKTEAV